MKKKLTALLLSASILFAPCISAAAELPPPPEVQSGQLLNQNKDNLGQPQVQPAQPNPAVQGKPEPVVGAVEKKKMYIKGYQLICPLDIPTAELQTMLAPYMEIAGTTDDMQAAAGKLVAYLRKQGYFLATGAVSDQPAKDFIYPLYIFPGKITKLTIENTSGVHDDIIAMQFSDLKVGDYAMQKALERGMAYVNDLQGQIAQMQVSPGKELGDYEIKIVSQPTKSWMSRTGVDNSGNQATGAWEANETVVLSNLAGRGDSLGIMINASPTNNWNNIGQAYSNIWWTTPAFTAGGKITATLMGQMYRQWNAYNGAWPDPKGWATNGSLGYEHSLVRTTTDNLRISATYESKLNEDYSVYWTNDGNWVDSEVNDVILAVKYNWSDILFGGGSTFATVAIEPGYVSATDPKKRQSLEQLGYYGWYGLATADISRSQYLFENFQLAVSANGQIPTEDLSTSEKLSITGTQGVRAYPYSVTSGDVGAVGSLELQYFPPYLRTSWLNGLRVSAFADAGVIKSVFSKAYDANVGQYSYYPNGMALYGYGVGMAATLFGGVSAEVQYALPIATPTYFGNSFNNGQLWVNASVTF
ncbi:MAG: ShlB/FhaC/HecB family hemolysin secretion/activation protein [Bacillota bacterium]